MRVSKGHTPLYTLLLPMLCMVPMLPTIGSIGTIACKDAAYANPLPSKSPEADPTGGLSHCWRDPTGDVALFLGRDQLGKQKFRIVIRLNGTIVSRLRTKAIIHSYRAIRINSVCPCM